MCTKFLFAFGFSQKKSRHAFGNVGLCVFDRYRFGKDPICTVRGGVGGGEAQNSIGKVFVGSKPGSKNGARKTEAPAAEPGHLDSQSPFVCQEYRAPLPETGGKDAPRARP